MVLLVIDTQKLITNEDLYNFHEFKNNVKTLIAAAREHGVEVIFVRHNDGEDGELVKGTDGFEIYEEFSPLPGEMIFDKTVNSPFRDTGLRTYLKEKGIQTVVAVGLQTDFCMDAAIKCGFEHGFQMIVPENTNSTVANPYMTAEQCYKFYNNFMWKNRYADCISVEEAMSRMKEFQA